MPDQREALQKAISDLAGLPCWNVQAGAIGSMASLHIGDKVPLNKPLPYPNRALTPDEHKFRGEYVLYIEDCPWRLESAHEVIALWTQSNAPDGPIVTGLKRLIGTRIDSAQATPPGMDLVLRFNNSLTLRVFPDQSDPNEGDNYSLSIKDNKTYIVAAKSTVYAE